MASVRWEFRLFASGENYDEYNKIANVQIEDAYQHKRPNVEVDLREDIWSSAATHQVLIDFQSMMETDLRTRETRIVRRRELRKHGLLFHFLFHTLCRFYTYSCFSYL